MPVDMSRYPKNWKQISLSIRKRSKGNCECTGECGRHGGRCDAMNYEPHPITGSKVILTVAHLGIPYPDGTPGNKHDKQDVRRKNLKAMCQRCHLLFDLDEHKANARETRRRKILATGQQEMQL
jgi:hypothetical protein